MLSVKSTPFAHPCPGGNYPKQLGTITSGYDSPFQYARLGSNRLCVRPPRMRKRREVIVSNRRCDAGQSSDLRITALGRIGSLWRLCTVEPGNPSCYLHPRWRPPVENGFGKSPNNEGEMIDAIETFAAVSSERHARPRLGCALPGC